MDSPLCKKMKELCHAAGDLSYMLTSASVEDVAHLRMQLNTVQNAIDDLTDGEVMDALFGREAPPLPAEGFIELPAAWKGSTVDMYNPNALAAEVLEVPYGHGDQVMMEVTNITRAGRTPKGPQHSLNIAAPVNARLTAAAVPDLSKCSTMVIKS